MKKIILLGFIITFFAASLFSQSIKFDDYFIEKSLRIDLLHAGNFESSHFYLDNLKQEPFWGGSKTNLLDKFDYGEHKVIVKDKSSGREIYSRGYSTLFQEWASSPEAKTVSKSFFETITVPYPKNPVNIEIYGRSKKTNFEKVFEFEVNPSSYFISPELSKKYTSKKIIDNGPVSEKVDVVFLADGYTESEMEKFRNDADRMAGYFFGNSPFKENKDKFNFWIVESPSVETGTDFPKEKIYKNTIINSSFSTFDVDRYLMTYDIKTVRDLAANVPYDQIIILVNSNVYGGGGVYNYYSITSVDDDFSDFVIVHEFGHAFGCLADEYYTSEVGVEDYYDLSIEPYEPNITTLVNFDKKWKNMVESGTPIPTPQTAEFKSKIGVFEGGGYVAKGVYRPFMDCTMKSRLRDGFCPVCRRALTEMIEFYAK